MKLWQWLALSFFEQTFKSNVRSGYVSLIIPLVLGHILHLTPKWINHIILGQWIGTYYSSKSTFLNYESNYIVVYTAVSPYKDTYWLMRPKILWLLWQGHIYHALFVLFIKILTGLIWSIYCISSFICKSQYTFEPFLLQTRRISLCFLSRLVM